MPAKIKTIGLAIPFGSLNAAYTALTPVGFPVFQLNIVNGTNQNILVSFDGATDNIVVGSSTNYFNIPTPNLTAFPAQMYIKYAVAPASGQVLIQYTGADASTTIGDWA
jgi:hypothetical protein